MNQVMWDAFVDEMEKISGTFVRVKKGGGRRVRKEHKSEEGWDPKALFQSTEGSEAAREQAMSSRTRAAGREVKSLSHALGMRGGSAEKNPKAASKSQRAKAKEKKK